MINEISKHPLVLDFTQMHCTNLFGISLDIGVLQQAVRATIKYVKPSQNHKLPYWHNFDDDDC